MLTALLWITLIASIITLTAIAAPIRVSCKAVYKDDGRYTALNASACYMHPMILRAEYSSTDEQVKFFILGFEKKRGGDKENQYTDAESINAEDISAESTGATDIDTKDTIKKDEDIDTDGIKMSGINKIIRNKPLRKKLLRWLKLSFRHATRAISFEKLKIHARIGLQDPATLGKAYGYFSAAQSALTPHGRNIDLSMEPVFTEKCLDIDSELKIKTTPSIILWRLIMIAAAFPYLRVRKII